MLSLQNHIAEIFGLITGCGLWIVWLNYLWQHGRVRRPQTEQVPLDGGGLLSHPIYPEALQDAHSSHVWITMTWKGEDWLRKVVLNFAFKLFGRKIAWAAHWVLVIERQHYCSYFELQRQRESEEPVRCLWSVLPTTDDDESPDYPLVMLGELPSRHDSERLLDAIPELDKMYVGTTSWSDAEIFGAGNAHFQENFPATHDYGVLNNNCQTFVYLLAKSLCPQSPLLLTQLPGVAPTVLRLLDLPPTICFISSALLVMGMVQNILKAISRIAAMEPKDIQEPAPLYFTHFFVLLYALSSVLNRRDDDFKSRYEPSQTIALDNSASAHSSSFGKSQNFIPWETKNRGFFWNKYEIILVVSSLIIALMYTGIADISDQGKTYYYLISIINIMILSLSFMGPYTLFAALTTASTLIIPFQFLFLSLKEVLVSKDPFGSADIIVDFVQIFLVFPFLCLGEMSLVLSMFKYHLFNM